MEQEPIKFDAGFTTNLYHGSRWSERMKDEEYFYSLVASYFYSVYMVDRRPLSTIFIRLRSAVSKSNA